MEAVVLAGGTGTRLRPYTTVVPKPLVPIGERPILEIILRQLARAGFTRVHLCVSHLGELIKAYFAESGRIPEGLDVEYHFEDRLLGTAGALQGIEGLADTFLVMNGDVLTDIRYAEVVEYHLSRQAVLTIATHARGVSIPLGIVEARDRDVIGFTEKPTLHYEASMGVYVYDRSALDKFPAPPFDFPDLVHLLLREGDLVVTYPFEGEWFDIGTFPEHEQASARFAENPELFDVD